MKHLLTLCAVAALFAACNSESSATLEQTDTLTAVSTDTTVVDTTVTVVVDTTAVDTTK